MADPPEYYLDALNQLVVKECFPGSDLDYDPANVSPSNWISIGDMAIHTNSTSNDVRLSQSFTAIENYELKVSQLRLFRTGVDDPNYQVILYAADANGYPTGAALMKKTLSGGNSLEEWRDIIWTTAVGAGYELQKGNVYCIVLKYETIPLEWTHYRQYWKYGSGYSGGSMSAYLLSDLPDSGWGKTYPFGGIWGGTHLTGSDFIFRNFGDPEIVVSYNPDDLITFPPTRPDAYDPDLSWLPGDWTDDVYTSPKWGTSSDYVATGGGRWGQNLVVAGNKKIYYEAFEI